MTYFTDADWLRDCEGAERVMAALWRELYPRIYPAPPTCGQYCSAKEPAHLFLIQCLNLYTTMDFDPPPESITLEENYQMLTPNRPSIIVAYALTRYGARQFAVGILTLPPAIPR